MSVNLAAADHRCSPSYAMTGGGTRYHPPAHGEAYLRLPNMVESGGGGRG